MKTRLGLVCLTAGEDVRYRTLTRARYLKLSPESQEAALHDLYADNLQRLFKALSYCAANNIRMYRALCGIFPLNDETVGMQVLKKFKQAANAFGPQAERLRVRVLMHPDQFVVLNSERQTVIDQSLHILSRHALVFDMLGLPRSPWSALIIHGGKSGRAADLIRVLRELPVNIRTRLALENDERAYSAAEILEICQQTGLPMVFDPHHHVIKDKLTSYEHPSVAGFIAAARKTWPNPDWQVAHISNGAGSFADARHSELITNFPSALFHVPWVEVEAKGKENAIRHLRKLWPQLE